MLDVTTLKVHTVNVKFLLCRIGMSMVVWRGNDSKITLGLSINFHHLAKTAPTSLLCSSSSQHSTFFLLSTLSGPPHRTYHKNYVRSRGAQLRPMTHLEVGLQLDPVPKPWRARYIQWTHDQMHSEVSALWKEFGSVYLKCVVYGEG